MSYSDFGSVSMSSSEEDVSEDGGIQQEEEERVDNSVFMQRLIHFLDNDKKERTYPKTVGELPKDLKRFLKGSVEWSVGHHILNNNWAQVLLCLRCLVKKETLKKYWYLRAIIVASKSHTSSVMLQRTKSLEDTAIEKGSKVCVPFNEAELKKVFKIKDEVGRGGFGVVYSAMSAHPEFHNKHKIAVKCLEHKEDRRKRRNFNEVYFLHTYKHENILEFGTAYSIPGQLWITLEFLKGGSLAEACRTTRFKENEIVRFAFEIGKALKYLHSQNVCHRDIKPANIMIAVDQDKRESAVKLVDFSLTCEMKDGPVISAAGTLRYKSPEMTLRRPHHYPTDMWSLGVTLIRLFNGELPYPDCAFASLFFPSIGQSPTLEDPSQFSSDALDIVTGLLQCDPQSRITAAQLCDHSWMSKAASEREMWKLIKQCFRQEALNEILAI